MYNKSNNSKVNIGTSEILFKSTGMKLNTGYSVHYKAVRYGELHISDEIILEISTPDTYKIGYEEEFHIKSLTSNYGNHTAIIRAVYEGTNLWKQMKGLNRVDLYEGGPSDVR